MRDASLPAQARGSSTRRLVRTPEVLFESSEIGLDAFGYNIANEELLAVLREALCANPNLRVIGQAASSVEISGESASVALADGGSLTPGRVFYFTPGHETYDDFFRPEVQLIMRNAVGWAAPQK